MAKYRKKPVVIDAFQWTADPATQKEDPEWICGPINRGQITFENDRTPNVKMVIPTPEGVMRASRGDYIIRGVEGEIYPCKPEIFEATYEAVE